MNKLTFDGLSRRESLSRLALTGSAVVSGEQFEQAFQEGKGRMLC